MEIVKTIQQITENTEISKQDSVPLAISNRQFALAIHSEKIHNCHANDLTTALRYCLVLSGVRSQNMPTQEEFDFLKIFILRNYPGHTVDEIRLAFDLAIAGKLDVDAKCYENFSCEYFGRIMTAYRKWASNEAKNLATVTEEPQVEPKPADFSIVWADILQAAKDGKIENKIIGEPVYGWLVEIGLLKLTIDDKKTLWINAKNKFQAELGGLIQMNQAKPQEKAEWQIIKEGKIEGELYTKITHRAKIQSVRELALKLSK